MSQNEIRESIEGSDLPLEYTFKINEGDGVKKVDATVKRGLLSITFEEQLDEFGVTKGPPAGQIQISGWIPESGFTEGWLPERC